MAKLTKEAREALAADDFAVPETRDLPIHDSDHVGWAWNNLSATKGLTGIQRIEARRRIKERAKTFDLDTEGWETSVPLVSIEARSLDIPNDPHPNKMPFKGVLTRIDEPSDTAPNGSNGKRVMITAEAAEQALDSLLGMAVDYQPDFDGHDPRSKIGVITAATIEGNAICIEGFIYAADFPDVAAEIKANKDALGFSFEARDLMTTDPKADPIPIVECVFTGAAILLKDKAAYSTTSISAAKAVQKEFKMDEKVQAQFDAIAKSIADVAAAVKTQGEQLAALKVEAANHLAKVEKHAAELEKAADHMDAAGIGGDPVRGHAVVLRNMAGDLRASAARGKMPYTYNYFVASTEKAEPKIDVEGKVQEAVEKATAELAAKLAEVKAAAEKAHKDEVASLNTKIADLEAKATEKATGEKPTAERKTLDAVNASLLRKTGLSPDESGKVDTAKLQTVLASMGLSPEKRIQFKNALAGVGMID